ncbi:MAG: pyridoxamine 5'-phosphate oxidase family protein [Candidatus Omnitrophota bacterium]|nr:pyridoxamine 5'-phosphate oxidase family protein [Candidatus Omnitrophota bacterium]
MFSKAIAHITSILTHHEFIHVGTCDFSGRPNVAPKFFLVIHKKNLVLVDYTIGKTYVNLQKNPSASLGIMDLETLTGYQVNGPASLIERGLRYRTLLAVLEKRKMNFSVRRIAEGVRAEKKHTGLELEFPTRVVFYRIAIKEIVTIGPKGTLNRKHV